MMNNPMTLNELVTVTEQARDSYRPAWHRVIQSAL
ncbi:Uncharacterised protein [Klebsiella pneumoniae]|uniref:Uncharacterized protein n=1 Tax=Klebsiella pneumoniae TaxID=573 RepID=A0A378F3L8_KLEPN|nr:Uncharacterised protein [Klebsiella pneumoniae]